MGARSIASAKPNDDNAMELTRIEKHVPHCGGFLVDLERMSGQYETLGVYSGRIRVQQRAHRDKGWSLSDVRTSSLTTQLRPTVRIRSFPQ